MSDQTTTEDTPRCTLCGEPMQPGEEMFKIHGSLGPCPKPPLPSKPDVIKEIAAERQRQIDAEGWTQEHDDEHRRGEMALAAACYARWTADKSAHATIRSYAYEGKPPIDWPWHGDWFKPKSRRRDLIRAAALIVAEIERLDRT